ncbi:uncharacterized protein GLRG_02132 [Colletotrichum graminicola M1.001]|uniref:DUF8004 domain-containing protein n=1 Tax=Colletotrichum graminicola (strain M1.001 / M2 / FGSC 10212) TaxID=645133 RepID=E3Q7U9_COLGM|nr:uncharacterized protein GLRG_02132 [Colletotrichum graminicola M1.001]EFQ26961.1 hypothetical protein GLRG_02132 [Colletotrichum graminicola M1.001]
METQVPQNSKVKRWDGAAKSCTDWDNLRRDPELWFRGGNCFVHLYGKGQSRRGPAFKVPFSTLLTAKCHHFVKRFMSYDSPESQGPFNDVFEDLDRWNSLYPNERVELYIPAPPTANKEQAFSYHLATRNFLAWVFRRSVVGEHLGIALIGLLNSMAEFRGDDEDNVSELISYMDEEGYLDIKGQPHHAVALLHLAEFFQMTDMYIDAFSHCVGMSEHLSYNPEFEHIGSVTKTLIRRARNDMDTRLSKAGSMLKTFLEDELSESYLGLSAGNRAHLDRFRSFVRSFYATKLGYWPPLLPESENSSIFNPKVIRTMRKDFQAVYELLVDQSFTSAESSPILAQGGICTFQSVNDFDRRSKYTSLKHPLPLLPETGGDKSGRRVSIQWLASPARGDKLKPDERLIAHSALTKAMNMRDQETLRNDFVRAYRKFEEDSVSPLNRVDKIEKISLVDARKVRWILIYCCYQTLLSCTEAPPEASDVDKADYHLAVSTQKLPPWKEGRNLHSLFHSHTDPASDTKQSVTDWASKCSALPTPTLVSPSIEIRPDIDYTAQARHKERLSHRQSIAVAPSPAAPPRSRSRSVPRSNTFRRSLSIFRKLEEQTAPTAMARKGSYCEIVVKGYGNGTNAVVKKAAEVPLAEVSPKNKTAMRSLSTSSESSFVSEAQSLGAFSFATAESTVPPTSPEASSKNWPNQGTPMLSPVPLRGRRRVKTVLSFAEPARLSPAPESISTRVSPAPEPVSSYVSPVLAPASSHVSPAEESFARRHTVIGGGDYAQDYVDLVKEQESDFNRHEMEPPSLQIRKPSLSLYPESPILGHLDDYTCEWDKYKHLGGLTSLSPLHI